MLIAAVHEYMQCIAVEFVLIQPIGKVGRSGGFLECDCISSCRIKVL